MREDREIRFADTEFSFNQNAVEVPGQVEALYFRALTASLTICNQRQQNAAELQFFQGLDRSRKGRYKALSLFRKVVCQAHSDVLAVQFEFGERTLHDLTTRFLKIGSAGTMAIHV